MGNPYDNKNAARVVFKIVTALFSVSTLLLWFLLLNGYYEFWEVFPETEYKVFIVTGMIALASVTISCFIGRSNGILLRFLPLVSSALGLISCGAAVAAMLRRYLTYDDLDIGYGDYVPRFGNEILEFGMIALLAASIIMLVIAFFRAANGKFTPSFYIVQSVFFAVMTADHSVVYFQYLKLMDYYAAVAFVLLQNLVALILFGLTFVLFSVFSVLNYDTNVKGRKRLNVLR